MRIPIFQIDAFTTRRFAGNPAAVMPMDSFLADAALQAIAAENNLASRRGGEIICRLAGGRIELEGTCVFYLEGEVEI